jgi:hypothetical protein
MVFVRDRAEFEKRHPALKIEAMSFLPWLTYLLSGGVTARCLIPNWMNGLLIGIERRLKPSASFFSLHWYIRVKKTGGN